MSFFTAGVPQVEHGFTPRELIAEQEWGELWRVTLVDGNSALLVAYTQPAGEQLFVEAQGTLAQWQKTVPRGCDRLLPIKKISDSSIPYLLVEDPQAVPLKKWLEKREGPVDLEQQAAIAEEIATAALQAEAYNLTPLGITTLTVMHCTDQRPDLPWRILPVAPASRLQASIIARGRYFPDSARGHPMIASLHADTFALGRLWIEMLTNDFKGPLRPPKEVTELEGLRFVLESCVVPQGGVYSEPRVIVNAIDRWRMVLSKQDLADIQKPGQATKRRKKELKTGWGPLRFLVPILMIILMLGGVAALYIHFVGELVQQRPGKPGPLLDASVVAKGFTQRMQSHRGQFVDDFSIDGVEPMALAVAEQLHSAGLNRHNLGDTISSGHSGERIVDVPLLNRTSGAQEAAMRVIVRRQEDMEWRVAEFFLIRNR